MSVDGIYRTLIAKSGMPPDKWLPLYIHLEDTAGIMECLIKEFASPSFAVSCGLEYEEMLRAAVFAAYVHDIGKSVVSFQYKISKNIIGGEERLRHYGMIFPDYFDSAMLKITPHALAGEVILRYLSCPEGIAAVVGAHHGVPISDGVLIDQNLSDSPRDIVGCENYFGFGGGEKYEENRQLLEQIWKIIVNRALDRAGCASVSELPDISRRAQMLISGLLITADWIASNTEYFPLISDLSDESDYPARVISAWEKAKFPKMWLPKADGYDSSVFEGFFGFNAKAVQQAVIETASASECPGIMILEAPMGCGKTEAALAAGEIFAGKLKKNGLFFGLPTQATANGIFPRIVGWAEKQSEDFYHSVQLKHGSAQLNETFRNIHRGIPEEENDSGLIVHDWFCSSKRACLANFVVGTVDQMLMTALKKKHVMLLHLGISEKVVIIDEVHAYDAYMNQYLEMALQWLGAYKTPVILLSATLPSSRRMALIRSYLGVKKSDSSFESNMAYPLLTWTDGGQIFQKALPYEDKHKTVKISASGEDVLLENVRRVIDSGGCVGVIMNTVKRAQQAAELIRNETDANVILYHAQYIFTDRAQKEAELLDVVGKGKAAHVRRGTVVVGTQVLEQSLDIDFDLLLTDICPIDLLLQRIGRLHRHDRDDRPPIAPECIVLTEELDNENSGTVKIYGKWLLETTLASLPGEITLPDDISPLVQKVYNAKDDSDAYANYIEEREISERRAKNFRLVKPKGSDIHGMLDRTVVDNDSEESVRDGISSIEVILMQKRSDGNIYFVSKDSGGRQVSPEPSDEEFMEIAQQKLRLPHTFCNDYNAGKAIAELAKTELPAAWKRSHWLAEQAVLFLDDEMSAKLMGYNVHYSFDKGFQFEKEEECE